MTIIIHNRNFLHRSLSLLIGISVIILGIGCIRNSSMNEEVKFKIAFLDRDISAHLPGMGYTLDSSWGVIQNAYPSKVIYSITEEDIALYDWSSQIITLTVSASKILTDAYPCLESDFSQECLSHQPFIVVYDGRMLYGGVFIHPFSAMGIQYPVIYIIQAEDRFALRIRPYHFIGKISENDSTWRPIRDPEVNNLFLQLSKLKE